MPKITRKETNIATLTATFTRDEVLKMLQAYMLVESGFNADQPREAVTVRIGPEPQPPIGYPLPPVSINDITGNLDVTVVLDFNKLPRAAAEAPK